MRVAVVVAALLPDSAAARAIPGWIAKKAVPRWCGGRESLGAVLQIILNRFVMR
jgi:hypothetical protein